MFKKFLFSLFALVVVFGVYNTYAFFGKNKTPTTPYSTNVTYDVTAISENDFNDDIDIQATSTPNTTLKFFADWSDDGNPLPIQLPSQSGQTTSSTGTASFTVWHKWGTNSSGVWVRPSGTFISHNTPFSAENPDGTPAASANYTVNITIPDTSLSNNAGITQNATVNKGTNVTFTCQNSSELYYGSSAGPSLVASKYSGASLTDYTLTYSTTLNTVGTFKVECDNIGGSATRKEMTFNVVENTSCPAPQVYKNGACRDAFDITNISSTPNKTNTDNTFT